MVLLFIWLLAANWGVSKVSADGLQRELDDLKKLSLVNWATIKRIEQKITPHPENKKYHKKIRKVLND
jgi:hypothetical protein